MKPAHGWVKLNIDGYSKGNSGPSSFARVFRDADRWLRGFRALAGFITNTIVELFAVREGLCIAAAIGYKLIVEFDSKVVISLVASSD